MTASADMGPNISLAENLVGHCFHDRTLLNAALQRAHVKTRACFERLEFLGDRVLALLISEALLAQYPHEREGALSARLTALVRREALVAIMESSGLVNALATKGEKIDDAQRSRPSWLADSCEAILGALYLDGGLEAVRSFILAHWTEAMLKLTQPPKDAKTRLQEWTLSQGCELPRYRTITVDGPEHERHFTVEVEIDDINSLIKNREIGHGRSRQSAETAAAAALYASILEGNKALSS